LAWSKKLRFTSNRKKIEKKTKSFGGKFFLGESHYAFKRNQKKWKKKLSLLAGKLSLGKKVCFFERCLVLSQRYAKSFGGKNLALCN